MYLDTPVAVPDAPGKITFREKAGTTYVYYEYERAYDPARQISLPRRATVGKLAGDGRMLPNENFARHFPELLPEGREEDRRSSCLRMGTFAVMRALSEQMGLPAILESIMGPKYAGLFLDLAFYSLVTEGNAAQHYPGYAFSHPLMTEGMRMYSDSTVSELLKEAGEEAPAQFLNRWNEGRDHRQRIWISYDSTNKSCQAGDISFVEPGHPKDGSGLPAINCSVAYDRTNSEPLFYEEYPGSVVDVSLLRLMLDKAYAFGYRRAGFILDRGYFSRANVAYLDSKGYPFVMMVKGMSSLVDSMVDEVRGTFETKRPNYVRRYETYGTTLERPLYEGDGKPKFFHVFHSSAKEAAERAALERWLERAAKAMAKHELQEWSMPKEYGRYFEAAYDGGRFLFATERDGAIERAVEHCGYFCIVTSERMSARDALLLYKSRDASEKLFSGQKSFLGGRSLRVHSDESASGKLLCEFVAMIVRNRMHVMLADHLEATGRRRNFMTVPAAVPELEKIELVRQYDGRYRLDHAVTATQKEILAAFGMDEAYIRMVAAKLGKQLDAIRKGEMQDGQDETRRHHRREDSRG